MGIDQLLAAGVLVTAMAAPGVAAFRHLGRGLRVTERFMLGLALAPFLLGLPALAIARLAHLPAARCLWPSEFIWMVAAVWPRRGSATAEPMPPRGQGFPAIAAILSAVGAGALVLGVALSGELVLISGDAWSQAAAVIEVARRGVPPQDPGFAGIPLYAPWFSDFLIASMGAKGRAIPFERLAVLDAWAATVLVLAVAQLAYRLFGRAASMWAGALVVLGLDPIGWLFALARHPGGAGMAAAFGTERDAAASLALGFPPSHVSVLNRLWNGSPVMPAVALCVCAAWSVARALERPSRAASLRVAALALAALAFDPAGAALALAALAVGLAIVAFPASRPPGAVSLLALTVALTVGAIAAAQACSPPGMLPYPGAGWNLGNMWALLLGVGPWWLAAFPALMMTRAGTPAMRYGAIAALAVVAASVAVVRPALGGEALFFLAWGLLAPWLATGWVAWAERLKLKTTVRLLLFGALVVPTPVLYTLGTALDPRSSRIAIAGESQVALRLPLATKDEREGYEYIRDVLPDEAVVIERRRPTANEPVTVLAGRRVFCGSLDAGIEARLVDRGTSLAGLREEFAVRRGIQDSLFAHVSYLDPQRRQYLAGFVAPLYLLARRSEVPDSIWYGLMERPEWKEELVNGEMQIRRFDPPPLYGVVR